MTEPGFRLDVAAGQSDVSGVEHGGLMMRTRNPDRHAANREAALAAFISAKLEFDALLAEIKQASDDHFGADPETITWADAEQLHHRMAPLRDLADALAKRGEYAPG